MTSRNNRCSLIFLPVQAAAPAIPPERDCENKKMQPIVFHRTNCCISAVPPKLPKTRSLFRSSIKLLRNNGSLSVLLTAPLPEVRFAAPGCSSRQTDLSGLAPSPARCYSVSVVTFPDLCVYPYRNDRRIIPPEKSIVNTEFSLFSRQNLLFFCGVFCHGKV